MMADKTILILNAIPNTEDMESLQLYLSQIGSVFKQFGGSRKLGWKTQEQIMGTRGIKIMAVFEFPSIQSIKDMMTSHEFNSLNSLRKKAYKQEVDLMICEAL